MSLLPPAYVVRREGNVLTCVCPSIHPSVCPRGGGDPGQVQTGGYPSQVLTGGGYPSQVQMGGWGGGTLARSGWGDTLARSRQGGVPKVGVPPGRDGVPPSVRTTEGVLATRQAVCLLRSRRRTFLLKCKIMLCLCSAYSTCVLYSL